MILFIDLESDALESRPRLQRFARDHAERAVGHLADIAGVPCRRIHHGAFAVDLPERLGARAVIFSGHFSIPERDYPAAAFDACEAYARDPDRPLLGICGGHQLIARARGGVVGPVGSGTEVAVEDMDFAGGEKRDDGNGRFGFLPVRATLPEHPLLRGLSPSPVFLHMHYWAVTTLPRDFDRVAEHAGVVQVMAHRTLSIAGIQSHPEGFTADHRDGRRFLANFLGVREDARARSDTHDVLDA